MASRNRRLATWAYTWVVATLAWPNRSRITSRSTPFSASRVPKVWRNLWGLARHSPAREVALDQLSSRVAGEEAAV